MKKTKALEKDSNGKNYDEILKYDFSIDFSGLTSSLKENYTIIENHSQDIENMKNKINELGDLDEIVKGLTQKNAQYDVIFRYKFFS